MTDDELGDQVEKRYQNTRYLAHAFCDFHFEGKKRSDFLFSRQSTDEIVKYSFMFDYTILEIINHTSPSDMKNALLPLHMTADSWLS